MKPVIFREYDIRGVFNRDFDLAFAEELGQAYVTFALRAQKKTPLKVAIGHDARLSSPSIAQALVRGLTKSGANVVELGLITSPISYFATFHIPDLSGAIMVTGSHNPPDYNGFKISVGNSTIFGAAIQQMREIVEAQDYVAGAGKSEKYDILPAYLERYKQEFGQLDIGPVVIDCGNGAAGCILRKLYEAVGLKPIILFEEPDGTFPNHHPDPTVEENLDALKKAVRDHRAVVGIGFDGDADRIGVVDENGRFLLGDELMTIISRDILSKTPGKTIIGDVKCSDRFFKDVALAGGRAIMWKTGHSLIKQKVKEEKAPFGGELSGHFFFADRNYGYDDALYAGLRLIEILAKTRKSVSSLIGHLPAAYNTPEIRIDTTEEKKYLIVERLKTVFSDQRKGYRVDLTDGIRISSQDGWALARASNTQPVLVLRFEAQSEKSLNIMQSEFDEVIKPLL